VKLLLRVDREMQETSRSLRVAWTSDVANNRGAGMWKRL